MNQPLDAIATAEAIASGEVSAREVVEQAIAGFEKHSDLNLLVADRFEQALADVDAGLPAGPLTGVPTVIKDLGMNVAGLPTTRGSRLWASDLQTEDSAMVARYKAAGLVILGMSNSPELGKNASTEPLAHGPSRNPWAPTHSTGGSSGGAAGAVAAGIVPVAHGNDGGGSIRIPSSMCGLFGLKPSRGRVSAAPVPSVMGYPLGINHALTRSVRDSALLLDIVGQPLDGDLIGAPGPEASFVEQMGREPGKLRIGLVTDRADGGEVDAECAAAAEDAAAFLTGLGHEIVPVSWTYNPEQHMGAFGVVMGVSLLSQVDSRLAELGRELNDDDLEPFTRMMYDHYRGTIGAVDYANALNGLQVTSWQVAQMFAGLDFVLTPTIAKRVPKLGVLDTSNPMAMWERAGDYSAMTGIFNTTGQPGVSLPWTKDVDGLPIGVQVIGRLGDEGKLLSLSAQVEAARPWPLVAP
ncbi:amidase [Nocardioides sp. Bht2]|uniref:amidase n=1 Tax=Nocardioides sp. Bht2 TaxID=3392297 RepID=UPI0039B546ED